MRLQALDYDFSVSNLALARCPSHNGGVSVAATMETGPRRTSFVSGQYDRVLRVRVSGFGRRFVAAVIDGFLLVSSSMIVTLLTALVLGAPLPQARFPGLRCSKR